MSTPVPDQRKPSDDLSPEEGLIFSLAGMGNYSTLLPWKCQERRVGEPKRLSEFVPVTLTATYDPETVQSLLQEMAAKPQDITLWYVELLFVGSPRSRVEIVKGVDRFKGYLSEFTPAGMVDGEPVAIAEVRIIG